MTKVEVEHVNYQELLSGVKDIIQEALTAMFAGKENQDSLLTRKQAAMILQVSEQTIDNYRKKDKLPSFIVGGNIRFKKPDVMNLLS